ncbi:replication initiator protein A [Sedimentitalea nanhaiensis]|uniref:Plasmid replication initiator protein n=1 Tax=Sedimentitalea nanhaiensis TaxID=999627 RepID=A0A1I7E8V1_9RHOB|nr:replication initiator protein A [Sedimentitalea nanhaiensis]SFU20339.1 Plasmid replication initiator protein [Sedimentitalea nanhaiensis]
MVTEVGDKPVKRLANPLLPDRFQQPDLFICDIFDAAPKSDMAGMEHPVFSISKKPDHQTRRYENGENYIEISPSAKGMATVFDRDILIFCISQLIAALNDGREVSKTVSFKVSDYIVATGKPAGGSAYNRAEEALERLRGTTIKTNIHTGDERQWNVFGLVESAKTVRRDVDGVLQEVQVTLSDWVFNAIQAKEVLTISRDYFRLKKPLERRMYEIARKHCGKSAEWRIGLEKLRLKCGSQSSAKEFKRLVNNIIADAEQHDHFPDYDPFLEGNIVVFRSKGTVPVPVVEIYEGALDPEAYHDARTAAPGWDVRMIEQEWRAWCGREEIEPKHPARHFIKFCHSWYEKRGKP